MPGHRLRYRRLVLAALLVGAVLVPSVLLTRGSQVHAQALIIAERVDVDQAALSEYGKAVFHSGGVAQAVADQLDVDADSVVPERVSLVAEPGTLVFAVVGHADDHATAALIANIGADTYVQELNTAGAGVGLFAMVLPAQPSVSTDPWETASTDPSASASTDPSASASPDPSGDRGTWTVAVPVALTVALATGVVVLLRRRATT